MACCGKKKISIPTNQQVIVDIIKNNSTVTKSNRNRPGTIAKQCPICGSKTITNYCPICSYKF